MSQMIVEYFNRFGHIPLEQLIMEAGEKENDIEKCKESLAPFCNNWQVKVMLEQNKSEDDVKKDCDMIMKAFFYADLDFYALSQIYTKSRQMPAESQNFVFENDVTAKLKPVWHLCAPPGVNAESIIEVLISMGDWLLIPKENPNPLPSLMDL